MCLWCVPEDKLGARLNWNDCFLFLFCCSGSFLWLKPLSVQCLLFSFQTGSECLPHITNRDAQKEQSSCVEDAFLFRVRRPDCDDLLSHAWSSRVYAHVQHLPWDVSASNLPNTMSISSLIYSRWLFVCTGVNYSPPIKTVSTHFRGPEWALSGWHSTSLMSLLLWHHILPLFCCHHFPMSGHAARRGQASRLLLEIKRCCASSTLDWHTEVASDCTSVAESLTILHLQVVKSFRKVTRDMKMTVIKTKGDLLVDHKCVLRVWVMS